MAGLVWYRNDLRVLDNDSLKKASEHERLLAVYCFDPRYFSIDRFGFKRTEKFRAKFLLQTVSSLRNELAKLNITLFVYHGKPEDFIPKLVHKFNISHIYLQLEWTNDENFVLNRVKENLGDKVKFTESADQFLFQPEDVPFRDFTKIPDVFTFFRKKCEKLARVAPISSAIKRRNPENLVENPTTIPRMEDLDFQDFEPDTRTAFPFKGGEEQGMLRLEDYFFVTKKLAIYKKTRNGLIGKNYSSKFSPWLSNGSLSPRVVYWKVKQFENEIAKNQDTYWLFFELIWRDYFKYISLKYRNRIFNLDGINGRNYEWKTSETEKRKWINGQTPEPFVNANMIELAKTGWMSNRGRQNVASYWAKHRHQDWRIGAAYFESLLLDYDVHSNWGNWMYNSGVGNDPRNRKFNIKMQAERYDPDSKYQNLWLNHGNK